jgi:AraC-like DNA-binding protein
MPQNLVPPRELGDRVDAFWAHEGHGRSVRVLPDGCLDFWFDLDTGEARLIGAMSEAALVFVPAGARRFGVRFRPGAAAEYVREPLPGLLDARPALGDVTHAAKFALAERVAEAKSHQARIGVIREFLLASGTRVRRRDARVGRAVRLLRKLDEPTPVRRVARALGLGERQLERLFAEQVGLGPKRFARIARLERAVALLETPIRGQAALAAHAGYADESHLIREFKALAAITPSEFARERHVGFVQSA